MVVLFNWWLLPKFSQQNDDQRSTTTASDEDGSITPRSVRFLERPKDSEEELPKKVPEPVQTQAVDSDIVTQKEYNTTSTAHRYVQEFQSSKAFCWLFHMMDPPNNWGRLISLAQLTWCLLPALTFINSKIRTTAKSVNAIMENMLMIQLWYQLYTPCQWPFNRGYIIIGDS